MWCFRFFGVVMFLYVVNDTNLIVASTFGLGYAKYRVDEGHLRYTKTAKVG